jgi:hypothetical protein
MGKKHDTFPEEQPEMPVRKEIPEVNQPADPRAPEIPEEDPEELPEEFPNTVNPQKGAE